LPQMQERRSAAFHKTGPAVRGLTPTPRGTSRLRRSDQNVTFLG
jgi:hypothetical protein